MRFAIILLVVFAGCASNAPIINPVSDIEPPEIMSMAAVDSTVSEVPPPLVVASWCAFYGIRVVWEDEVDEWQSGYPTNGAAVSWFKWQTETITPAIGAPPESTIGLFSKLEIMTMPADRDSFRVRVACIDSFGVQGGFTPWTAYYDTLQPGGIEE